MFPGDATVGVWGKRSEMKSMSTSQKRMAQVVRGEVKGKPNFVVSMAKEWPSSSSTDGSAKSSMGITPKDVSDALDGMKGAKELECFFNSNGGSAYDGVAIYNMLCRFPGKKTFYNDAMAASAASVVFLAGDERIMMPGSQVMVHGPSSVIMGNAAIFARKRNTLEQLSNTVGDLYLACTK